MQNKKLIWPVQSVLRVGIFLMAMSLISGSAFADRPEWAGHGDDGHKKHKKHKNKHEGKRDREWEDDDRDDDRRERRHKVQYQSHESGVTVQIGGYFGDRQITETHEYYRERARTGHCPPGLAKKNNGCAALRRDRDWHIGENIPQHARYDEIDPSIQIKLGLPPPGHKFVQVASDILMIAVGSGLIIDAIQDLGQ